LRDGDIGAEATQRAGRAMKSGKMSDIPASPDPGTPYAKELATIGRESLPQRMRDDGRKNIEREVE
jgi:hypothetical protein